MSKLSRTILVADEKPRPDMGRDRVVEQMRSDALDRYARFFARRLNATISHVRLEEEMALELLEGLLEVMYDPSTPPKLAILPTDGPSEQHNEVRRILTGTLAEEIIRNAPIPILAVGRNAQERVTDLESLRECRILVATDFGRNSRRAEKYALELCKRLKSSVTLLHCLFEGKKFTTQSALGSLSTIADCEPLKESLRHDTVQELKKRAVRFARRGIDCDVVLNDQITLAAAGIVKQAYDIDASFIVMSTHRGTHMGNGGSPAFQAASLGSTCRAVIHHAPVPVFIIPNSET